MKNIYLINSGKPEFQNDSFDSINSFETNTLSNLGLEQSRALGFALREKELDLIVTSDFNDALATAACIAVGQSANLIAAVSLRDQSVHEPSSVFFKRVVSYYKTLLQSNEKNIALVSHTGVIRAIITNILGISEDYCNRLSIDYGSVSVIIKEGEICYLKSLNTKIPLDAYNAVE